MPLSRPVDWNSRHPEEVLPPSSSKWDDSAREYAVLASRIKFHNEAAEVLVRSLPIMRAPILSDVGCGSSGLIQKLLLSGYSDFFKLYCIDSSSEMINVLQSRVSDSRLFYIVSAAEDICKHVTEPINIIVINSAVGCFDLRRSFLAFKKLLAPKGIISFTMGEWDISDLIRAKSATRYKLIDQELSARGLPSKGEQVSRRRLSIRRIHEVLAEGGLKITRSERHSTKMSVEDWVCFYSIQAIAARSLPGLHPDHAVEVLGAAMRRFDWEPRTDRVSWMHFHATHADGGDHG